MARPGIVELQDEAGVDDRAVLVAQRLGRGHDERFVVRVVVVGEVQPELAGRDGRHEHLGRRHALQRRAEGGDVLLDELRPAPGDRSVARRQRRASAG